MQVLVIQVSVNIGTRCSSVARLLGNPWRLRVCLLGNYRETVHVVGCSA